MVESSINFNVFFSVFYLKCDKRRESNSYQVYIKLCYSYVLVLFLYKVRILSTLYSSSRVKSAFYYRMVVATRMEQQRSSHRI
jgi:hypothetical protein